MSRLRTRRVARWLIASLLFSLLHPAFAATLAVAQGSGGLVQICTGAGMTWVRLVDRTAEAGAAASQAGAQDLVPSTTPADGGDSASTMSPCPFCLGAALAPGASTAEGEPVDWPPQAPVTLVGEPCSTPACERVILDAPTRGPPRSLSIA